VHRDAVSTFGAAAPLSYTHPDEPVRTHRHGWWWKVLLSGALLWIVTIVVTIATRNTNLVPTLILLGSFLVPFSVVLFAAERISSTFPTSSLMIAFFVGGVLGVLGASLLEAPLTTGGIGGFLLVGLIEELVKAVLLVITGRHLVPKTARQGALLGATVGAGFAAFESAGYAFNAAITTQGLSLVALLQTEVLRAVLTPLGHVLWTAVFGAAIFAAARAGVRYRLTFGVIVAFVGVAVLHGLWDSMGTISSLLAVVVTGNAVPALEYGFVRPDTAHAVSQLTTVFYVGGLAVLSIIGIVALLVLSRRMRGRDAQVVDRHFSVDAGA
jgi:RsiW-degrading membrane proteinase PrsW (M82 family)